MLLLEISTVVHVHKQQNSEQPQQHEAAKLGRSMETDLLVQGFKEAETKYGLQCGLLVMVLPRS